MASTLGISDQDYLAGGRTFTGNGASAAVSNAGAITVGPGGYAALIGGSVANSGTISVPMGKVGLGSGELATLDFSGDGFLQVGVPTAAGGTNALVSNSGKIIANGGQIEMKAAAARDAARQAINMSGVVEARSVSGHDGDITLDGGNGAVVVSGKMNVSSRRGKGGTINVTGGAVTLAHAKLNASGKTGGGNINIGGGPHASVALADAQSVSINAASVIRADATGSGNGGHIVVWSDGQTTVAGTLSAQGGPNGGNGGLIETSGESVDFTGIKINASASNGTAGTWLIDPTDLTIDSTAASTIGNTLSEGTNVTLQTNADGTTSGPGTTSSGAGDIDVNSAIYNYSTLSTLTVQAYNNINVNAVILSDGGLVMQAGSSVNVNSGGSITSGATTIIAQGNIIVNSGSSLDLSGATTLTAAGNIQISASSTLGTNPTLTAGGLIQISAPTSTSGGAALSSYSNIDISQTLTNSSGGTITLQADSFGTGAGTVSFSNGATLAAGGATVNIFYNPTSYASPTNYSGNVTGGSLTAYMLVNSAADLEAIDSNLHGTYALAADINAGGANITPIGYNGPNSASSFTGLFDGENHIIYNFTINTSNYYGGCGCRAYGSGLFEINAGTIRNVGVSGSVSDALNDVVGGLAAWNTGTISNSFSTMSVTSGGGASDAYVGGLVGRNSGLIENGSYATGSISATGDNNTVGGLAGGT